MTNIFEILKKLVWIIFLLISKYWLALIIGVIGSLIASIIFLFFLISRRPKMEIFPAIIKNTSDNMCYIVLWLHHTIWHRKQAIDLKISALLLGNNNDNKKYFFGNSKIPYAIPIQFYIVEFPVLKSLWHNKEQRYLIIPIKLDEPKLFNNIYYQLDPDTVDNDLMDKINSYGKKNNRKKKDKISEEKLCDCFLKLFPNVYEKIQISINYQDDTSGVRKTKTDYINQVIEKDITKIEGINWIKEAEEIRRE